MTLFDDMGDAGSARYSPPSIDGIQLTASPKPPSSSAQIPGAFAPPYFGSNSYRDLTLADMAGGQVDLTFSSATKAIIKEHCPKCWVCQNGLVTVVHVVSVADRAVRHLEDLGLLNFERNSVLNGITLCASCHQSFDNQYDPGFVFFPTDLQYFINYELEDRRKRQSFPKLPRRCPSAEEYKANQISQGDIQKETRWGLYTPCRLVRTYFAEGLPEEHWEPKPWHGAPMAAIRRSIMGLGSFRTQEIPKEALNQLRYLQDLYQTPIDSTDEPSTLSPLSCTPSLPSDSFATMPR